MRQTNYDLATGPHSPRNRQGSRWRYQAPWEYFKVRVRNGEVEVWQDRVVKGHLRVSVAIADSKLFSNPIMFESLIQKWTAEGRAADDNDRTFSRKWEERLNSRPHLAQALKRGKVAAVCELAGLTAFQTRAIDLSLDGKTPTEVARALGLGTRQAAHDRISKAFERILALDLAELSA